MADHSKIEWTEASWNPVTGCTKVSPGCDHCYAETFAERFRGAPGHYFEHGFDVMLREDKLELPLRWTRPRRIFVNSMSDLFHDAVPDLYITKVFDVMEQAKHHTFQLLTKRHARMRAFVQRREQDRAEYAAKFDHCPTEAMRTSPAAQRARNRAVNPPANIWLGISVESQAWADIRVPALLSTPAAVRWLSCEPLLGPVDLSRWLGVENFDSFGWGEELGAALTGRVGGGLHWVVTGGESGPGARPMHPDWARSLRDQCHAAGVPYFFKQWGNWAPLGPLYEQSDDDPDADEARMEAAALEVNGGVEVVELETSGYIPRGHQPGDHRTWLMGRLGKKTAGREIDGRTWDEYPAGVR
jgi:protein gp37